MVLVGVPPTLLAVVRPLARVHDLDTTDADRVTARLVVGASLAVVVSATALAFLDGVSRPSADALWQFLTTVRGSAWFVQVGAALLVGAGTAVAYRRDVGLADHGRVVGGWLCATLGGGLLVLVALCWTSYSTAIGSDAVAIATKLGHMVGAALWVGGLLVLASVVPPLLVRAAEDEPETEVARLAASTIRRFSVIAAAGVTLAVATGLLITAWHVPTIGALGSTLYGVVLTSKVALVLVAAALGAVNRTVVHHQLQAATGTADESRTAIPGLLVGHRVASTRLAVRLFVRSVRVELAVLVVIVLSSVLLTTVLTPSYAMAVDFHANAFVASLDVPTLLSVRTANRVESAFPPLLELGALAVSLTGVVAVGYEAVWARRD